MLVTSGERRPVQTIRSCFSIPLEVTDQDSAASAAGATAIIYAILQGQKTVETLEEFGHILPEMIYVFLLVFSMFMGKMIGDGLTG